MGNKQGGVLSMDFLDKHRPDTRARNWSFHVMDGRRYPGVATRSNVKGSLLCGGNRSRGSFRHDRKCPSEPEILCCKGNNLSKLKCTLKKDILSQKENVLSDENCTLELEIHKQDNEQNGKKDSHQANTSFPVGKFTNHDNCSRQRKISLPGDNVLKRGKCFLRNRSRSKSTPGKVGNNENDDCHEFHGEITASGKSQKGDKGGNNDHKNSVNVGASTPCRKPDKYSQLSGIISKQKSSFPVRTALSEPHSTRYSRTFSDPWVKQSQEHESCDDASKTHNQKKANCCKELFRETSNNCAQASLILSDSFPIETFESSPKRWAVKITKPEIHDGNKHMIPKTEVDVHKHKPNPNTTTEKEQQHETRVTNLLTSKSNVQLTEGSVESFFTPNFVDEGPSCFVSQRMNKETDKTNNSWKDQFRTYMISDESANHYSHTRELSPFITPTRELSPLRTSLHIKELSPLDTSELSSISDPHARHLCSTSDMRDVPLSPTVYFSPTPEMRDIPTSPTVYFSPTPEMRDVPLSPTVYFSPPEMRDVPPSPHIYCQSIPDLHTRNVSPSLDLRNIFPFPISRDLSPISNVSPIHSPPHFSSTPISASSPTWSTPSPTTVDDGETGKIMHGQEFENRLCISLEQSPVLILTAPPKIASGSHSGEIIVSSTDNSFSKHSYHSEMHSSTDGLLPKCHAQSDSNQRIVAINSSVSEDLKLVWTGQSRMDISTCLTRDHRQLDTRPKIVEIDKTPLHILRPTSESLSGENMVHKNVSTDMAIPLITTRSLNPVSSLLDHSIGSSTDVINISPNKFTDHSDSLGNKSVGNSNRNDFVRRKMDSLNKIVNELDCSKEMRGRLTLSLEFMKLADHCDNKLSCTVVKSHNLEAKASMTTSSSATTPTTSESGYNTGRSFSSCDQTPTTQCVYHDPIPETTFGMDDDRAKLLSNSCDNCATDSWMALCCNAWKFDNNIVDSRFTQKDITDEENSDHVSMRIDGMSTELSAQQMGIVQTVGNDSSEACFFTINNGLVERQNQRISKVRACLFPDNVDQFRDDSVTVKDNNVHVLRTSIQENALHESQMSQIIHASKNETADDEIRPCLFDSPNTIPTEGGTSKQNCCENSNECAVRICHIDRSLGGCGSRDAGDYLLETSRGRGQFSECGGSANFSTCGFNKRCLALSSATRGENFKNLAFSSVSKLKENKNVCDFGLSSDDENKQDFVVTRSEQQINSCGNNVKIVEDVSHCISMSDENNGLHIDLLENVKGTSRRGERVESNDRPQFEFEEVPKHFNIENFHRNTNVQRKPDNSSPLQLEQRSRPVSEILTKSFDCSDNSIAKVNTNESAGSPSRCLKISECMLNSRVNNKHQVLGQNEIFQNADKVSATDSIHDSFQDKREDLTIDYTYLVSAANSCISCCVQSQTSSKLSISSPESPKSKSYTNLLHTTSCSEMMFGCYDNNDDVENIDDEVFDVETPQKVNRSVTTNSCSNLGPKIAMGMASARIRRSCASLNKYKDIDNPVSDTLDVVLPPSKSHTTRVPDSSISLNSHRFPESTRSSSMASLTTPHGSDQNWLVTRGLDSGNPRNIRHGSSREISHRSKSETSSHSFGRSQRMEMINISREVKSKYPTNTSSDIQHSPMKHSRSVDRCLGHVGQRSAQSHEDLAKGITHFYNNPRQRQSLDNQQTCLFQSSDISHSNFRLNQHDTLSTAPPKHAEFNCSTSSFSEYQKSKNSRFGTEFMSPIFKSHPNFGSFHEPTSGECISHESNSDKLFHKNSKRHVDPRIYLSPVCTQQFDLDSLSKQRSHSALLKMGMPVTPPSNLTRIRAHNISARNRRPQSYHDPSMSETAVESHRLDQEYNYSEPPQCGFVIQNFGSSVSPTKRCSNVYQAPRKCASRNLLDCLEESFSNSRTSSLERSAQTKLLPNEQVLVTELHQVDLCPECQQEYDGGKKRKLTDTCGHGRCYSCMFSSDVCPVCAAQNRDSPPPPPADVAQSDLTKRLGSLLRHRRLKKENELSGAEQDLSNHQQWEATMNSISSLSKCEPSQTINISDNANPQASYIAFFHADPDDLPLFGSTRTSSKYRLAGVSLNNGR